MTQRERDTEIPERLSEALSQIRIDQYKPWRYLFFVFLAGIARGIGFALGMTIILAVLIFVVTKVLASMVNFPLIGTHIQEFLNLLQNYMKSGARLR